MQDCINRRNPTRLEFSAILVPQNACRTGLIPKASGLRFCCENAAWIMKFAKVRRELELLAFLNEAGWDTGQVGNIFE
jgi:hypothetical protein